MLSPLWPANPHETAGIWEREVAWDLVVTGAERNWPQWSSHTLSNHLDLQVSGPSFFIQGMFPVAEHKSHPPPWVAHPKLMGPMAGIFLSFYKYL